MSRPDADAAMFVHSDIDDLGLDPFAFRVYATICRRAGDTGGEFYESVNKMAERVGMSIRRARRALRDLEALGLIDGEERRGQTTRYRLTPRSSWVRNPATDTPAPGAPQGERGDVTPAPHAGVGAEDTDTPAPHAGVPRHQVQGTPAPGAAKGSPLSSSKEGSPLSLRTATETSEPRTAPPAADAAERETQPPSRKGGRSKAKGTTRSKAKGAQEGEALAKRTDLAAYLAAYDEHRGMMPATIPDAALRSLLGKHEREHGPDELLRLIADATQYAATADKDHKGRLYWVVNQLGLPDLLKGDNLVRKAAAWRNTRGMSAGDRELAAAAYAMGRGLPDDAERKRQRDAELAAFDLEPAPAYPDVEPGDLLDGANVEGTFTATTRPRKPAAGPLGHAPDIVHYHRTIGRELPAVSSNGSPEPQPERNPEVEHHGVEQAEPRPPAEPPKRRELTKDEREAKEAAARAKLAEQSERLKREHAAEHSKGAE
jgi:DNA-binding transcriptional ArsR family regulator